MKGYLFTSPDGVFFQPTDFYSKKDFLFSIDRRSLKILEYQDYMFSDVLANIGDSLSIKRYFQDSLDKTAHKNKYILHYFKASVRMEYLFNDSKINIDSIGYGFIYKDSLYYHGNFRSETRLFDIIPEKTILLKKLYDAYIHKGYSVPVLLNKVYRERFSPRKVSLKRA